jgi:hypothetical protein
MHFNKGRGFQSTGYFEVKRESIEFLAGGMSHLVFSVHGTGLTAIVTIAERSFFV